MKTLILVIVLTISSNCFAGPGGGHSHGHGHSHSSSVKKPNVSKEEIIKNAKEKIKKLVVKEKVDKSWNEAIFDTAETKVYNGQKEWLVTFTNEKGVKGKKIFIFLKMSGEVIAANFTGK